ncbi:MAG: aminoacetone oxidase family FAD-binding enzyme [Eubacteriaceae bacterium]|nr:aminoacetone oxidase family FAD-binding enzyme [Eubacteriaceae bacterium]
MIYDCIIIGAGAAGLFAASGIKVNRGLILEKTHKPASKLLMSGGGQCNITHSGDIKEYVKHYGSHGGKIRSCLYRYSNTALIDFLRENGVETITREDGKVFPASMDAGEIQRMLLTRAECNHFTLRTDAEVMSIDSSGDFWILHTPEETFSCRVVIIATGGCSYPATGSDGSFFKVLQKSLSLKITTLKPSLSPAKVYDYPYTELSGISFTNAAISLWNNDKKVFQSEGGDLLLTHQSFSGPVIINNSRYMENGQRIEINYLHPLSAPLASERISEACRNSKAALPGIVASEFNLPKAFVATVCNACQSKTKAIAQRLTADSYTVKSAGGFNSAMATAGGIDLSEVNLKTMALKKHRGIFAIGECLDIDGDTGGYNLQFAYSSAMAAAESVKGLVE